VRLGENSYKKVLGGAACLLLASAYLVHPGGGPVEQFGGARLVYGFDFEELEDQGARSISERHALEEYRRIITERLDPYGAHIGFAIRPEGDDRVVIEFPFTSPEESGPGSTLRALIENAGELSFYINVNPNELGPATDITSERGKVDAWVAANPTRPIRDFNRLSTADGGAAENMLWFPYRTIEGLLIPVTLPPEEFRFTGEDLENVSVSQDPLGRAAVGFSMKRSRSNAFGEFTGAHVNEQMAIVLNDEVVTNPYLNAPLYGDSIIEGGSGGFTLEEVEFLVQVLRSGQLPVRPHFIRMDFVSSTALWRTISSALLAGAGVGAILGAIIKSLLRRGTNARPTSQSDQPQG
jgi:preprotein translocase subunit SecD